ncbi:MAG TPA: beta-galactosidase, partial [Blastocatellia bacterium]
FVELCKKHGLFVVVRIGPWAHGEARNGGFPDWLLKKCDTRKNDPIYLGYVRQYFDEIGKQLQGLMWKDGGPIIGVQLENEYVARGPGQGAAHLIELKKIAREAGIVAPLYTVTGWMNPEIPEGEALPVFGGYPDAFWDASLDELPPSPNYFFTPARDDAGIGTDLIPKHPTSEAAVAKYPYLMAEAGGGMAPAYHRRPVITADDIAAIALAKIGSGANLYGYYMFHGGTNPDGLGPLQESQATGYWNDLQEKGYDYQAPLGEFGRMHPSFRKLKLVHLFLTDFGGYLAPMRPVFPTIKPSGLDDRTTVRAAGRFSDNHGFVFVSNYERGYPMPDHANVQIAAKLPSETVVFPRDPVTIPSGSYFIWPVNLDINGVTLKYSTAQLLLKTSGPVAATASGHGATHTQGRSGTTERESLFFFSIPGIAPEFAFDERTVKSIQSTSGKVIRDNGRIYVTGIQPGLGSTLTVTSTAGETTAIVLLTKEQAENCWKLKFGGQTRIVVSPADVFGDGQLHLRSRDVASLRFSVFGRVGAAVTSNIKLEHDGRDGMFESYSARINPHRVLIDFRQSIKAKPVPPVKSKRVAEVPDEAAFDDSGVWDIRVPATGLDGLSNVFLRIDYAGDVGRLYGSGHFITDDFYMGTLWEIGLNQIPLELWAHGLQLKILPLRKDAPIYLPKSAWPAFPPGGQLAEVKSITAVPEYEVSVGIGR